MNRNSTRKELSTCYTVALETPPSCGFQMRSDGAGSHRLGMSPGGTQPTLFIPLNKSWSSGAQLCSGQFNKPLVGTSCMPGALTVAEDTETGEESTLPPTSSRVVGETHV